MKRFAIVLCAALALSGCAGRSILDGGSSFTAPISNPVTPTMLYEVENVFTVIVAGALDYKLMCIQKIVPQSCRGVIAQMQTYTRQARTLLPALRRFVRNNDQVSAISAYNMVRQIISDARTTAVANAMPGVK